MRIRTVEYEPGWGWIARDPRTGKEVIHDFRWSSRAIARQVVSGVRHGSSELPRNLGIHAGEVEGDAGGVVCILCV